MLKFLIGIDVITIAVFIWRFPHLPDQIPLFYSKPWGEAQIADSWYLFVLPVLMNVFFFFNRYIAIKFFPEEAVFEKLLRITNIILMMGFTAIYFKILFLIT